MTYLVESHLTYYRIIYVEINERKYFPPPDPQCINNQFIYHRLLKNFINEN
jgi:hypothetical protein